MVYRVADSAGLSDDEAFVWTICPAQRIQGELVTGVPAVTAHVRTAVPGEARIQGELVTGVPEVVARVRVGVPAPAPEEVEDRVRAVAGAAAARTGRSFSSALPPDDEQLFPLAAKLGQVANFEAAWFLGRPAFLADVSVPRSFELMPTERQDGDEVNVNKGARWRRQYTRTLTT